jgi:hypothetical protein
MESRKRVCLNCGTGLGPYRKKYCSGKCYYEYRKNNNRDSWNSIRRKAQKRYYEKHKLEIKAYHAKHRKVYYQGHIYEEKEYHKKYYQNNRDKFKLYARNYYNKHRNDFLVKKYGISVEGIKKIFDLQCGKCAICGTNKWTGTSKSPHVDHDHKTNKVRGLLCGKCNQMIGLASENPVVLLSAAKYLGREGRDIVG